MASPWNYKIQSKHKTLTREGDLLACLQTPYTIKEIWHHKKKIILQQPNSKAQNTALLLIKNSENSERSFSELRNKINEHSSSLPKRLKL